MPLFQRQEVRPAHLWAKQGTPDRQSFPQSGIPRRRIHHTHRTSSLLPNPQRHFNQRRGVLGRAAVPRCGAVCLRQPGRPRLRLLDCDFPALLGFPGSAPHCFDGCLLRPGQGSLLSGWQIGQLRFGRVQSIGDTVAQAAGSASTRGLAGREPLGASRLRQGLAERQIFASMLHRGASEYRRRP